MSIRDLVRVDARSFLYYPVLGSFYGCEGGGDKTGRKRNDVPGTDICCLCEPLPLHLPDEPNKVGGLLRSTGIRWRRRHRSQRGNFF